MVRILGESQAYREVVLELSRSGIQINSLDETAELKKELTSDLETACRRVV
ncbi:MAG: hypothetical protein HC888_11375 [Candidatus Competibacteraceae bacterium]|nr:hypothetical protein [Candidatus Competibacteraceae bacterium]